MNYSDLLSLVEPRAWDTELAFSLLHQTGQAGTKRTAERRLHELGILPQLIDPALLRDEVGRRPTQTVLDFDIERQRAKRRLILFAQLKTMPDQRIVMHANDSRGARYWFPLEGALSVDGIWRSLKEIQMHVGKHVSVFPHGELVSFVRNLQSTDDLTVSLLSYPPKTEIADTRHQKPLRSVYLDRLEAESIFIIREAVAEAENPAILYSIGKDSSVLLHLARKAFFPSRPPLPLLHIDTRWKFQEMYQFRDLTRQMTGMELHVHTNPEAIEKDINPFDHGAAIHTKITKTDGLKQAIERFKFDMVLGGARRDEEKSRAKERVFSFRNRSQVWDPKKQRPELWNLYNTRKADGESIRVFPLSNWTELDVWQYILQESIPIVPLYFSKERPVVFRDNFIIAVDDERMRLGADEKIVARKIRFRTLGCYPLTGGILSNAATVEDIIVELLQSNHSERQGRLIDAGSPASMEKMKTEGYF
jgi:sulfate adenylyltransferase subunit 2